MAEPTGKYIYISNDLNTRKDPFIYTLRYCESVTNHNNAKDALKSEGLAVKTLSNLTPGNSILQTPTQTIAAGFNISENCVGEINNAISSGIPVMIVSDEGCFVEFIEYTIIGEVSTFECICKLKRKNGDIPQVHCAVNNPQTGQTHTCLNEYEFCQNVEKKKKDNNKSTAIQDQLDKLLRTGAVTDTKKGRLPVFRYSQFLDFVTWRNYMGEKIENVRIQREKDKDIINLLKKEIDNRVEEIVKQKTMLI